MNTNVGGVDRAFRLLVGLVLIAAPLADFPVVWESATLGYVSMAFGAVLFITGSLKFCPIYRVLGLSTCKTS